MKIKLCLGLMLMATSCAWGMEKTPSSPPVSLSSSSVAFEGAFVQMNGAEVSMPDSPKKQTFIENVVVIASRIFAYNTATVAEQADEIEMVLLPTKKNDKKC
jgi:hypothetical protein